MTILDKFNLSGKTALVTGARRGIGKAIAVALAEAGADIVATSAGMEAKGSAVALEVEALRATLLDVRLRSGGSPGGLCVHRKGEGRMPSRGHSDQQRRLDPAQTGRRAS